jgi:hypothetical protein
VLGGVLQRLEDGVLEVAGGLLALVQDVDLHFPGQRPVMHLSQQLPGVVYPSGVGYVQLVVVLPAAPVFLGHYPGQRGFAGARRPVEQESPGAVLPLQDGAEAVLDGLVAEDLV